MKLRILNLVLRLVTVAAVFAGSGFAPATAQETLRQYLSGKGKDDAVPWRFQCTSGANAGVWTNLPVPSHWDVHGFGTLSYKKDGTNALDERGLYEREFAVPNELTNRRIFIVFEGVMTDTAVKINGQSAGPAHQGGFYRFKYEITDHVKFGGTNLLEVDVARHSANKSVNDAERLADYWVFAGIYRPVYLEAVPRQFIQRVAIDARADGRFAMDVFINGEAQGATVEAQVIGGDGKPLGSALTAPASPSANVAAQFESPLAWSAETPHLHTVIVSLKQGAEVLHRTSQRFGFRTVEVRDGDGIYVNGRRVILKGVNRHSFWPDSGRCLSTDVHKLDIETMKEMNMNAVRMSHYPPDAEFLDLCDELGLYVLDELAGWHRAYDTEVGRQLVEEMVARDVNHPSILFWDNGNEGGWNTNLDADFKEWDPQQRRVLHPWAAFSGLCTAHYLAFDKASIAATGQAVYYHNGQELVATNDAAKYIYMPTEMLHGLYDGGLGAGLEDYWRMMSASKLLGGAFLWTLVDEAVKRPDTGELDPAGNQAPDGIVGPYREREASFYTIKQIWSPIQVRQESSRTFTVENHYSFTDANQCRFTWELRQYPTLEEGGAEFIVLEEAEVEVPSIEPGSKGSLRVPALRSDERVDAHALRVEDPSGRELWTWIFPRPRVGDSSALVHAPAAQKAAGRETPEAFEISAGELTIRIARDSARLAGITRGEEQFSLVNGPRFQFTNSVLRSIRGDQDGPDYIVAARFEGDLKSILWRVHGNGWVRCEYRFSAEGSHPWLGAVFDYPEEYVTGKRWMGGGPSRVWKNRLAGVTFGVWEDVFNDTIPGYQEWEYPAFKGCLADVRWMQWETTEGTISVVPEGVPFIQVLTPGQAPDELIGKTKVQLPDAGLGLLHAIPPIGTKFKDATHSGPQSQLTSAKGEYSGAVSFYFGDLPEEE
ncbi:MAG TPA: glycoside hydrolase family 2 TIM barrel-domain containing protein [Verrucomicrobiae bacterium]|nr:glycoside hydrolase family 2 TIM barrel-domain containing protein [Verrucomicrobiae bacterium]